MPHIKKKLIIYSKDRIKGSPSKYLIRVPPTFKDIVKIALLYFNGFPSIELDAMVTTITPSTIETSGTQGVLYDTGVPGSTITVTDSPSLDQLTVRNNLTVDGSSLFNMPMNVHGRITSTSDMIMDGPITSYGVITADNAISLFKDLTVEDGLHPNQIRPTGTEDQFLRITGGVPAFGNAILGVTDYSHNGVIAAPQTIPVDSFVVVDFHSGGIKQDDHNIINTTTSIITIPPDETYAAIVKITAFGSDNFDMVGGFYESPVNTEIHVAESTHIPLLAGTDRRYYLMFNCLLEGGASGREVVLAMDNGIGSTLSQGEYQIRGTSLVTDSLSVYLFRIK